MRIGRVRTRAEFAALASRGRRARRGTVRLTALPDTEAGRAAVAFAIGRAVGPAVVRNRVRRRLRAALAELAPLPGTYLVGTTPAAAERPYAELRADLDAALAAVDARSAA